MSIGDAIARKYERDIGDTPLGSLQERVTARIHESIGDLITTDDLTELVQRHLAATFFTERTERVTPEGYGRAPYDRRVPPMIESILANLLRPTVETICHDWFAENEDAIRALLDETVTNGAGRAVLSVFNQVFHSTLRDDANGLGYVDSRIRDLFG